jgi:release factor glutamine methyltransferase
VDRRALIPRPETELLIELITQRLVAPPASILDLGTGTGAIALALATKYPEATVMAVDQSEDALALAGENATSLSLAERVKFLRSDWFAAVPVNEKFSLIVSNPPYLTEEEARTAQPEVRDHEPVSALVAADEGVADLEKIITGAKTRLAEGGFLACETGIAQHPRLKEIAERVGFARIESLRDLTGRDRFLFAFV